MPPLHTTMVDLSGIEVLYVPSENSPVESLNTNRGQQRDASSRTSESASDDESKSKKRAGYLDHARKATKFIKEPIKKLYKNHNNSNGQHSPTQSNSPPRSPTQPNSPPRSPTQPNSPPRSPTQPNSPPRSPTQPNAW